MKIDVVSAVYRPEPIVSSRTSTDLAEQLCEEGDTVRVITTFPNRPAGKLYDGYKRSLRYRDHSFSGYEVFRYFTLISSESSVLSRFLENISFGIASGLAVLFSEKPDVIYGNTWPIFAEGILALACRLRGVPLVTSVQDTYPESLAVQGRLADRTNWLYRLLRWLDKQTKQSCAAVMVISERFKQIYVQDRGIAADKVHLIPNWIDENVVQVNPADNYIRGSHEIPDDAFLVVYAGNIGTAAGVETVIRAFEDLTTEQNIYLLIAGSGSKLFDCRELAGRTDNPRVLFHTPWLDSETSSMLAAASLFILPTIGAQSLASVPSKLISYMLASRPILCCAVPESDIAKTIADASCGWAIPPDDPHSIAKEIKMLSKLLPAELQRAGERGRMYALQHMTRKANLPVLVKLVRSAR